MVAPQHHVRCYVYICFHSSVMKTWFLALKHTGGERLVDGNLSGHTCASHPTHSALRQGPHPSPLVLL